MNTLVRKLGIWLIIVIVSSIPTYLFYENTKSTVIEQAGNEAKAIAYVVAASVSKDAEAYAKLYDSAELGINGVNQVEYQRMLAYFQSLRAHTSASYIFTEKKISESEIVYVLDAENPKSENFSPIGSKDSLTEIENSVFITGEPAFTGLIDDPYWGQFITGFAAIRDEKNGTWLGIAGVDYSAEYVNKMLGNLRNMLIYTHIVIALITLISVHWMIDNQEKKLNTDYLTRLKSKRTFKMTAQDLIDEARRTEKPISLIMIDVNYFKQINDMHGHPYGDKVLKDIADHIGSSTRRNDHNFRLGGDEFAVLLPDTDANHAQNVKQRIQENSSELFEELRESDGIDYSLSVGYAQWEQDWTVDQWISAADKAMYQEKNQLKLNLNL